MSIDITDLGRELARASRRLSVLARPLDAADPLKRDLRKVIEDLEQALASVRERMPL